MTLWRIRATVDDRPGYLSVLTASLALRGVNILTVQVHTTEQGAVDDFLVDAPDTLDEAELVAAVERGRGRDCWVARSEARGLADQPTRALGLATRLVRDPDATGEALRTLLGADAVSWRPASAGVERGITGAAMLLADPAGGSFALRRAAPAFTPAEYARAQALVELAATVVAPGRRPGHPGAARRRGGDRTAGRRGRPVRRGGAARGAARRAAGSGVTWAGRRRRSRPACVGCWSRAGG